MGKTRRKFSLEFEQQILAEIASGQKSLSQAAREYQVSASVINRWRAQAEENQLSATPSARKSAGSGKRASEGKDRRPGDAERLFKKVPKLRTTAEKRQFVRDQWEELGSVKKACEVIGIRPSTYYYRPKVDPQVREKQDADLKEKIEVIQVENPGYGYRRVYHHMRRAGAKING